MREIFDDIFSQEPVDPVQAVRRGTRRPLPQRFYQAVGIDEGEGGFGLLLDDRPVKTPGRRPLVAPTRSLAEALAAEWDAQREFIDPARMPLTRLANSIVDGVSNAPGAVAEDIAKYLQSDLVFYRASTPARLIERQAAAWDPILAWARESLGAHFTLGQDLVFVAQPQQAVAAARASIPDDPWRLGALHVITTLTGSALIALALLNGRQSLGEAWAAAHVDEDWNMEQWGGDEAALARRDVRFADMQAAATVLALLRD